MVDDLRARSSDLFFEGSPLPGVILGEGGRVERANAALCQALGFAASELQELTFAALVIDGDRAAVAAALEGLAARPDAPGAVATFVCRVARKDGAVRRFRVHCGRSPDGAWVFATALDVTEAWEQDEALKKSEIRLQAIIRQMPLALVELSPGGDVLSWNPAAERIFGYPAEEAVGRQMKALIVPEGAPDEDEKHTAALLAQGHSFTTLPNVTKDGRRIVCEWHLVLARDDAGSILSIATLAHDVTERVRGEERLRSDDLLLRVVLDNVPVVLWSVDRDGIFTRSDGAGLSALGLAPGEVVGRNLFDIYRDFADILRLVRRALAGETSMLSTDEVGGAVWETRYMSLRDAHGHPNGVVGLALDVTERNRAEKELRRRLEVIEEQRGVMRAMSMPIMQVSDGVLALPVIGALDGERAAQMMEALLVAVVAAGAQHVIVDLTGVTAVDEATADHLVRVVSALSLVGARTVVTGIQPGVAGIMVSLGLDLSRIATARNLKDAIRRCTQRAGR